MPAGAAKGTERRWEETDASLALSDQGCRNSFLILGVKAETNFSS